MGLFNVSVFDINSLYGWFTFLVRSTHKSHGLGDVMNTGILGKINHTTIMSSQLHSGLVLAFVEGILAATLPSLRKAFQPQPRLAR